MRGRSSSTPKEESRTGAFGFDRLEWMISVCRRLRDSGYEGESRAFRCDDLRYYLFLEEPRLSDYLPLNEFSFISEYGTRENARALGHFLCEHGTAICEQGAIEQLGIL